MTQSLAYKAIMEKKQRKEAMQQHRAENNIFRVRNCVEDKFEYISMVEAFWKSIQDKDLDQKTKDFVWMVAYDAHWSGTHWLRPSMKPELQQRAVCSHCGVIEDLEHKM
ncbi:hypothetical protein DFJ43DRAFT_1005826 [Lentinula guzmanii]|uniref:Uncharacterized protein n=1 Tax=Lentinula guzmanii TaxID=2804957 RepID=A0AA38JAT2_9AGAR|nr:hypothetical protein DFJ43DRAFT_1005826 [Lentinula guzmanii]